MPNRQEVFAAIDSELAYQDAMTASADRPDMIENLSAGDHILAMEAILADARREWYFGSSPHPGASEYIRKVTALGFRFMLNNSAPLRQNAG